MTEWRIKEISELTKISVRMLRHYDKIGLLKPSYRAANGYRCYTEQDLAKLQQIIALKYFGFDAKTIKSILQKHHNIYAHLQAQQQVLKKRSLQLQQVNDALDSILKRLSPSKTPDWNDLITLIERYRMSENLREKLTQGWAGQKLNKAQFEEYLAIYEMFPKEFAEYDKLIEKVNNNEFGDPSGPDGERVVQFILDLTKKTKEAYTKQLKLGSSLLKDIQLGKISQFQTTPEATLWISRAMLSFWLKRWDTLYDHIVENLSADPAGKTGKKIAGEWTGLIDDVFSYGPRSFVTGLMLWQDLARQAHEFKDLQQAPSPQELAKKVHVKLFFNPEAVSWINRALEIHAV
jgi:DNA-binding transcriptional MerR regulator